MNFKKLEQIKREYRKLGKQTDALLEQLYKAIAQLVERLNCELSNE